MVDSSIVVTAPRSQPRIGVAVSRLRDETLARRISDGDERAFAEIHRRYHGPLYRYCRSIVRHEHDAQDVLQTTLMAAYAALRAGRRDAPLRPWLYRIAHNESISLLRRRRPEAELTPTLPDLVGVEERADVRERMSRLVADLIALPERQRSALVMRELNGLSHEDIALALRTTPAAAKQTVFEARRALSELDAGRAMSCDDVCRTISDGDGRQLRGRRVRSHLRACRECAAFAEAISTRRSDLRALAPGLPAGVGTGLLWHVLGGPPARSSTGAASVKALGAGALTKTLATGLLIAGGVAGYTHLTHGAGRALGRVGAPMTRAPSRGSSPPPAPARSMRSGGPGVGPGVGRRAGGPRHDAAIRVGDQSGRRPGAAAAGPSTPGRSSSRPRPSQFGTAAGSTATRTPVAPPAWGRRVGAHDGAPAVGAPARGASAGHAVHRGRPGADQPPGQGRRSAGSTARGQGSGGASSRGWVSNANPGQFMGSAPGAGVGLGRSSAPGEGEGHGLAATSIPSTAGVTSPGSGSGSGSGIGSAQSHK